MVMIKAFNTFKFFAIVFFASMAIDVKAQNVPSILEKYNGPSDFEARDFHWLKGSFPDASPQEKAAWKDILTWADRLESDRTAAMSISLDNAGIKHAALRKSCYGDLACSWARLGERTARRVGTWEIFSSNLPIALGYIDGFRRAVASLQSIKARLDKEATDSKIDLEFQGFLDQIYRQGVFGSGENVENLPSAAKEIVNLLLYTDMIKQDNRSAEFIEKFFEKHSWSDIASMGKRSERHAWLILDHVTANLPLQIKLLNLAEKNVSRDPAQAKYYVTLFDRTSLFVYGKQRYGTQLKCEKGQYIASSLEAPGNVDKLRTDLGLSPLAEYIKSVGERC